MNEDYVKVERYSAHYSSPFPLLARFFLNDSFDNWENLTGLFANKEEIAERILNELKAKVDTLPQTDYNRIVQVDLSNFITTQREDLESFYNMIEYYRNLELSDRSQQISTQLSMVKKISKKINDAVVVRDTIRNQYSDLHYLTLRRNDEEVVNLIQIISEYKHSTLKGLAVEVEEICNFVDQAIQVLLNYQLCESRNLHAYVQELRKSWNILFGAIETLSSLIDTFNQDFGPILNDLSAIDDDIWSEINRKFLTKAAQSLIAHSLIIVEFPSWNERSLRTKKKKFPVTLEILLPSIMSQTKVEAYLLSEDGYSRLQNASNCETARDCDCATKNLYQSENYIQEDHALKIYKCNFTELGFDEKISRKRPKSMPVMSVKHVYMFRALLSWRGMSEWARCFSLPVVISSHTDQNIEGSSAIFWDNNFRVPGRDGLQTRADVSWTELASAIKLMISRKTGRGPTDMNMKFIRSLFMGPRGAEETKDDERRFKQNDLGRLSDGKNSLPFWDWLMATINLLTMKESGHLLRLWRSGHIIGYISKADAAEVIELMQKETKEDHCFLLRFSKREGKAIVLQGYIEGPQQASDYGIYSVDPYKPENLRDSPLEQRVMNRRDCKLLIYEGVGVWAACPKQDVFEQFLMREKQPSLPDGYVGRQMSESTRKIVQVPEEMLEEEIVFFDENGDEINT